MQRYGYLLFLSCLQKWIQKHGQESCPATGLIPQQWLDPSDQTFHSHKVRLSLASILPSSRCWSNVWAESSANGSACFYRTTPWPSLPFAVAIVAEPWAGMQSWCHRVVWAGNFRQAIKTDWNFAWTSMPATIQNRIWLLMKCSLSCSAIWDLSNRSIVFFCPDVAVSEEGHLG